MLRPVELCPAGKPRRALHFLGHGMGKHYASGFEDYLAHDGAKLLAKRIEDYWRGRVKTTLVREMSKNGNQPV